MPFCSNCGKELTPTDRFCASCGKAVNSTGSSFSSSGSSQGQPVMSNATSSYNNYDNLKKCPECGKMTDSLKQYSMFEHLLFLICYVEYRRVKYTCCPDCMRKHLLSKGFFTKNLITGNFMWLISAIPETIIKLYLCGQKGHSKGV